MKILVERKWKKEGYTIGNLFVDGKLVCNTLEPQDFGLVNEAKVGKSGSEAFERARNQAILMKARKGTGKVAIPSGHYFASMEISQRFHARRLFLRDVPGFQGIMFHEGNTKKDTQGCILVGWNRKRGQVLESKKALGELNELVLKAYERGEQVYVQIIPTPCPPQ